VTPARDELVARLRAELAAAADDAARAAARERYLAAMANAIETELDAEQSWEIENADD
jgi:hypothetical protein